MIFKILALVAILFNYASFLWTVRGVFLKFHEQKKHKFRALKIASVLMWVVSIYELVRLDESFTGVFVALIVANVLFCALFWWSVFTIRSRPFTIAFSTDIPEQHVSWGPYRWVRHPFYTAYLGTYLSVAVATLGLGSVLVAAFLVWIYWQAANMEEGKFLRSSLATAYKAYRRQTGMFFPKLF